MVSKGKFKRTFETVIAFKGMVIHIHTRSFVLGYQNCNLARSYAEELGNLALDKIKYIPSNRLYMCDCFNIIQFFIPLYREDNTS